MEENKTSVIDVLDSHEEGKSPIVRETISKEDIKKLKLAFDKKTARKALTVFIVGTIVVLLAIGAILGGVFGSAASYAKKSINYEKSYAETVSVGPAKQAIKDRIIGGPTAAQVADIDKIVVHKVYADLDVNSPLKLSKYYYKVELKTPGGFEVVIMVDSKTGTVAVDEVEYDG
ncbi:MAG: hypothetical protein GX959_05100 [Clostridiales bacterium]|jgi:hypothetical protein|nr:hypothetical protein [Clostridiales bacterium]